MTIKNENSSRGFEDRLLPMLLEVVREGTEPGERVRQAKARPRRSRSLRRRVIVATAVACLALLFAIVVPSLSDDPLGGALAISRQGDVLYLRVDDALADPDAMTEDLRSAGVDGRVDSIPVSPSLVGKWVDVVNDSTTGYSDPRTVDLFDQMYPEGDPSGIPRASVLTVPVDLSSPITLLVGRSAQAGEQWRQANNRDVPDETRPGGVLHCLLDEDPLEADRVLQELGYAVDWRYSPGPTFSERVPVPSGKVIVYGELLGPDTLLTSTVDPNSRAAQRVAQQRC